MKKKVYILSIIFLLIDIFTKQLVKNTLNLYDSIPIIPNFFSITYVINDGAAFSILKGELWLFIILGFVLLFFIFYYLQKEKLNIYKTFYYSLLIAGVLGNLLDRMLYKGVIDFLDFTIFSYNAPIFNLADTFIVISVILIVFESLKEVLKKWISKLRNKIPLDLINI